MVDVDIPIACGFGCGGTGIIPAWIPSMMFDDETEAPPPSYGYGWDSRTTWVRQIFKIGLRPQGHS